MPDIEVEFVEGWTGPLDFTLKDDGTETNLSGTTVTGISKDRDKQEVTLTGDVSILSATDGTVRINPDTGDFPAANSPFTLRFKVVDGGGAAVYYPNGKPIKLTVRPE